MDFTRKTAEHTRGYCQNCGRPSHCGGSRWEEVKDYACDGGELRMIKVCDGCRCSECSAKAKKGKQDGI